MSEDPAAVSKAGALSAAGEAAAQAGDFEAALALFAEACELDPGQAAYRYNQGNMLRALSRFEAAIAAYDAAVGLSPRLSVAHYHRALCRLQLGDLAAGFREYEWRKACPTYVDPRYRLERPWRGEDLTGRSLFIYPELFQGDLIQFSRYAILAERAGAARVALGAPRAMHRLLRTMSATLELLDEDASPEGFDFNSALMSLPAAFGTTLETVPRGAAYLSAEPERVARWRERIGPGGIKIGVAWQGSTRIAQRSFPLAALRPLSQIEGVRLISLQKHSGLEQLDSLPQGMQVESLGDDFDPGPDAFVDTAAAMTACDLVISCDTSTAHLAGALGRPTWLALDTASCWRWLTERTDCPWYPSVRLFRQPSRGDWDSVAEALAAAVRQAIAAGPAR